MKQVLSLLLLIISTKLCKADLINDLLKQPSPHQEDILKPGKSESFPHAFRKLILEVAPEEVGDFLELAKQHFECIKNPSCRSDFDENRKTIVGPPGAGKTTLAKVLAEELGLECLVINAALLANEYANSALNNFARAIAPYLDRPCVIVLDEVDAILKACGVQSPEQKVPQQIWQLFDILEKRSYILVIGTTNSLEDIPVQLQSRFKDNLIESPKKISNQLKKKIINYYLGDRAHNCSANDLDKIIDSIPTYLGRDIEKLVKGAINYSKRRKTQPFLITKSDFEEALKKMNVAEKLFEKKKEGWVAWAVNKGTQASNAAFLGGAGAVGAIIVSSLLGKGGTPGGE
jgi:SpoVK/Ycf46/Vps4 family AAA+-type ATPase